MVDELATPGSLVRVEPPWSPEQIESLNEFQNSAWHPFTCPNRRHRPGVPLTATRYGWACEGAGQNKCDYAQNWAHSFMADGSWRQIVDAGMDLTAAYERELGDVPRSPSLDAATLTALAEGMTGRLLEVLPANEDAAPLAYMAYQALFRAAGCTCRHSPDAGPVYAQDVACPIHGAEHATPPPAGTGGQLAADAIAALAGAAAQQKE